jgi:hypothetical protein
MMYPVFEQPFSLRASAQLIDPVAEKFRSRGVILARLRSFQLRRNRLAMVQGNESRPLDQATPLSCGNTNAARTMHEHSSAYGLRYDSSVTSSAFKHA